MEFLIQLIFVIVVVFFSFVMPAIRRSSRKAKKKRKLTRRLPRDFGNILLDGVRVSERGKGVLNPKAMYSETNKADMQ